MIIYKITEEELNDILKGKVLIEKLLTKKYIKQKLIESVNMKRMLEPTKFGASDPHGDSGPYAHYVTHVQQRYNQDKLNSHNFIINTDPTTGQDECNVNTSWTNISSIFDFDDTEAANSFYVLEDQKRYYICWRNTTKQADYKDATTYKFPHSVFPTVDSYVSKLSQIASKKEIKLAYTTYNDFISGSCVEEPDPEIVYAWRSNAKGKIRFAKYFVQDIPMSDGVWSIVYYDDNGIGGSFPRANKTALGGSDASTFKGLVERTALLNNYIGPDWYDINELTDNFAVASELYYTYWNNNWDKCPDTKPLIMQAQAESSSIGTSASGQQLTKAREALAQKEIDVANLKKTIEDSKHYLNDDVMSEDELKRILDRADKGELILDKQELSKKEKELDEKEHGIHAKNSRGYIGTWSGVLNIPESDLTPKVASGITSDLGKPFKAAAGATPDWSIDELNGIVKVYSVLDNGINSQSKDANTALETQKNTNAAAGKGRITDKQRKVNDWIEEHSPQGSKLVYEELDTKQIIRNKLREKKLGLE